MWSCNEVYLPAARWRKAWAKRGNLSFNNFFIRAGKVVPVKHSIFCRKFAHEKDELFILSLKWLDRVLLFSDRSPGSKIYPFSVSWLGRERRWKNFQVSLRHNVLWVPPKECVLDGGGYPLGLIESVSFFLTLICSSCGPLIFCFWGQI